MHELVCQYNGLNFVENDMRGAKIDKSFDLERFCRRISSVQLVRGFEYICRERAIVL